jgi:hypothetical protein
MKPYLFKLRWNASISRARYQVPTQNDCFFDKSDKFIGGRSRNLIPRSRHCRFDFFWLLLSFSLFLLKLVLFSLFFCLPFISISSSVLLLASVLFLLAAVSVLFISFFICDSVLFGCNFRLICPLLFGCIFSQISLKYVFNVFLQC